MYFSIDSFKSISPHIVQLMVLLIDPIGPFELLLALKGLNRWILIHFYFRLISRNCIYFFGRFSGMKKAALEKLVPKCDIFFFFSKDHQVGGTMGRRCRRNTPAEAVSAGIYNRPAFLGVNMLCQKFTSHNPKM